MVTQWDGSWVVNGLHTLCLKHVVAQILNLTLSMGTGQSHSVITLEQNGFFKKTQMLCMNLTWTLSQGELRVGPVGRGGDKLTRDWKFLLIPSQSCSKFLSQRLDCKAETTRYDEQIMNVKSMIDDQNLDRWPRAWYKPVPVTEP